jgi:prepilin-type processing-associated H-X9-DG protein
LLFNGTTTTEAAVHTAEIQSPAQLIAIAEFWGRNNNYPGLHPMYQPISTTDVRGLYAGHLGRSNYLFCDGHVKSYLPTQTASPIDMWDINKQNQACASLLNDETATVPGLTAVENYYATHRRTN